MSDAELPEFCTTTTPLARKRHECVECDAGIQPGDRYECTRGNWQGTWATFRTCLPCVEERTAMAAEDGGYYEYGDLRMRRGEA